MILSMNVCLATIAILLFLTFQVFLNFASVSSDELLHISLLPCAVLLCKVKYLGLSLPDSVREKVLSCSRGGKYRTEQEEQLKKLLIQWVMDLTGMDLYKAESW